MTKKDLARSMAKRAEGMTIADAQVAIDVLGEALAEALVAGEEINIPKVGKLYTKEIAEKSAVMKMGPSAGKPYTVPAHKAAKFKPSMGLKESLK